LLPLEDDLGGAVASTLESLPPPFPSWLLPELAAGAPVEGKDGGGQASPFLSTPLPLPLKTCAVVVLFMVVAGSPDPATLWVDLAPRSLDPALATRRWCRHT